MSKYDTDISLDIIQGLISQECDGIKKLLLGKNLKYGNSAIEPKRIFSKQNPIEQLKVRIDDKLSRIANLEVAEDDQSSTDDAIKDLIGYLILLRVAEKVWEKKKIIS